MEIFGTLLWFYDNLMAKPSYSEFLDKVFYCIKKFWHNILITSTNISLADEIHLLKKKWLWNNKKGINHMMLK